MDLNEILDGMAGENCANSCGGPAFNNNCGNPYDNCGPSGVAGYNNFAGNNNCCGGFNNNCGGFGCGGGFASIFWLLLLCGGGCGFGGFGGGRCGCCQDDCCGGGYGGFGNGCAPLIWIIVLATLCGGCGFGCGNNNGNNFLGNCGC
ncbi:hypothetical protein [Clostridium sp. B9]|uniref:hypothetical protein n=1 Tax=Clostridium sp. B9 TaxID=3423224 RepID=UPI003D2EF9E2